MNKLLIILLFILLGCNTSQNIIIEKFNISLKEETSDETERKFLEMTPKILHKQKNQALIFFVSHSFYNDTVFINKKDTLIFESKLPNDCGLKPYAINKKGTNFKVSTNRNNEIKIKNIKEYDYILIKKYINNTWQISYYSFFPILNCM